MSSEALRNAPLVSEHPQTGLSASITENTTWVLTPRTGLGFFSLPLALFPDLGKYTAEATLYPRPGPHPQQICTEAAADHYHQKGVIWRVKKNSNFS